MVNLDVDLGTPDEKIRAIALMAAAEIYSSNPQARTSSVIYSAIEFEKYIKTGSAQR